MRRREKLAGVAGIALALASSASVADVNLQTLAPTTNSTYVLTENAAIDGGPLTVSPLFSAQYNFLEKPLMVFDRDRSAAQYALIDRISTLDLTAGASFGGRMSLAATLPLHTVQLAGKGDEFALGDTRLQGKFRVTPAHFAVAVSLIPEVFFPTGVRETFISNGSPGLGARLAVERPLGPLLAALNVGYRHSAGATYREIDFTNLLPVGVGAFLPVGKDFGLNAEASADFAIPFNKYNNPGDLYVGGSYRITREATLQGGASFRSIGSEGDGHYRFIVGLKLAPPSSRASFASDEVITRQAAPAPEARKCEERPYTASFPARALSAAELERITALPYAPDPKSMPTLQIGERTGFTKDGLPYVHDSQVVFAVDVTDVPPRNSVADVHKIALQLNLTKVTTDAFPRTEVLCLLEEHACSGELYSEPRLRGRINPSFAEQSGTANSYFADQLLSSPSTTSGGKRVYSAERTLELSELLRGTRAGTPLQILTGRSTRDDEVVKKRTLYFAVADDTYVSLADSRLVVHLSETTCR